MCISCRLHGMNHFLRFKSKVLCHVNDLYAFWNLMLFHEIFTLAVTETKEEYVNFIKRELVCENKTRFPIESFMNICNWIPGIARAIGKYNFGFRMI